jgi:transposase InsO family protein
LSLILDAYTEEIVGRSAGSTFETTYQLEALWKALKRMEGQENIRLIHEYVSVLKRDRIRIGMTEGGNPKNNAQAKRINRTMKNELLKGVVFRSIDEVKAMISAAVDFYNNERLHMSIDMMMPTEAADCTGEIAKRWKSYRHDAISSISKCN